MDRQLRLCVGAFRRRAWHTICPALLARSFGPDSVEERLLVTDGTGPPRPLSSPSESETYTQAAVIAAEVEAAQTGRLARTAKTGKTP